MRQHIRLLASRIATSEIARSFRLLNQRDKEKVLIVGILQILMGVLDLLGVLAIGLLGALSVSGIRAAAPGFRLHAALSFLHISEISFQRQAFTLGLISVVLLVGRTILSIFFTRRILFFFSRRGAAISANLVSRLLSESLLTIQSKSTQDILYMVTRGVDFISVQVLATSVVLVADFALLLVMALGLLIVNPYTAVATIFLFGLIVFILYRTMHVRASVLGKKSSELSIESNEKIVEVFSSYRESVVRNRRDYYAREISKLRLNLADTTAEYYFMPYVSKYVIETSVILGGVLLGGVQFFLHNATTAVTTMAIFLAAGSRLAPSVLRVQQGLIQIRSSLGMAGQTLDLIDSLAHIKVVENFEDDLDIVHKGFHPKVVIKGLEFTYPGNSRPSIVVPSLEIPAGISVAVVGPSGAGKTTLIDLILGVLPPDKGFVTISTLSPLLAFTKWPGAVSYVSQDVVIANTTVRANVSLGYPIEFSSQELVMDALSAANLTNMKEEMILGLETRVGERGAHLSGGQRQRLGIARAMFTKPHLLVLDEATSALDGETESGISDAIRVLRGVTTVIMIAHRLSTVRDADLVVYLADGKIISTGSFDEVRIAVPDFDNQAKLMGL